MLIAANVLFVLALAVFVAGILADGLDMFHVPVAGTFTKIGGFLILASIAAALIATP